ncbi:DNA polymerase IV [Patescibacteria group bacterium]|nr:DNA polymerase IV [Patescibacteria group bacterium]
MVQKKRIILHIDMDYFFAQIEERENPQFKGRPVVVGADPKEGRGRGVVSTANYEARKYGVNSAMPISLAWQACPKAIFLPVNMELYKKVTERIMIIIKKYSKIWEVVSLDEAYLDISSLNDYKNVDELAKKLKKEIFEKEKITSTIGIGPNKLIAKMATNKAKPNGLLVIKLNQVKNFLEPLDVEDLPGIGPKTGERLKSLKIQKIKNLKKLSKEKLQNLFGKWGISMYEKVRGIDENPVIPEKIIKSIGKEHTFARDTRDPEIIFGTFDTIIKGVHEELLENGFSFKIITVVCRYQGFETHTKSKTLKEATDNLEILKKEAKNLLLRFLIENPKLIRLIGTRVSSLQKIALN